MAEETLYTIGQLAELAGVTPRTIRYYTAEGLLPRPDARGQYALYGEQHLLRLQLIARLKETYLPLSEIKTRIENLDAEQLRILLDEDHESPAPATSATDYLAQVRLRQHVSQSTRHLTERAESYTAADTPTMSLRQPTAPPVPAPAAPAYGFAAAIAAPIEAPERIIEEAATVPPQQAGLLRRLLPQRRPSVDPDSARTDADAPKQQSAQEEQRWRRVELAPGVELHIRDAASPALHERIERLLATARSLFRADD
ncbi:MAG: MerR family transcriptional regulator [Roseiflexaceae bacterium]